MISLKGLGIWSWPFFRVNRTMRERRVQIYYCNDCKRKFVDPRQRIFKKRVEKVSPLKVVKIPEKKGKVQTLMDRAFPLFDKKMDYKDVAKELKIQSSYASVLKSFWKKAREKEKKEKLELEEDDFSDFNEFNG